MIFEVFLVVEVVLWQSLEFGREYFLEFDL